MGPECRAHCSMPRDVLNAHLLCFSTATFLLVAKMRLYVLLMKQEENAICNVKDWVVREASNQDALQEAGTFRYCQERKPRGRGGAGRRALQAEGLLPSKPLRNLEPSTFFP